MTTGFAYKTSDDPGAPQLTHEAGTLIAVLDYILDPLHWDKVFTGTNEAVYRAKAGNRNFLQVLDNQLYGAKVRGFTNMTSLTAGENMYPPADYVPGSYWIRASSTSSVRAWRAVVTDRFILLFLQSGAGVGLGRDLAWFGDLLPAVPGNPPLASLRAIAPSSPTITTNLPNHSHSLAGSINNGKATTFSQGWVNTVPANASEASARSAWGVQSLNGKVGPVPHELALTTTSHSVPASIDQGIQLVGCHINIPVDGIPATQAPSLLGARIPFLYQASVMSHVQPVHGDVFETVDGERLVALDAAGTQPPSSSYFRFCMMISDHETEAP